jgi:hypothetical protein
MQIVVHLQELTLCPDTSCILAWLIEQGYEVYAFMADVGQEEARMRSALALLQVDDLTEYCYARTLRLPV